MGNGHAGGNSMWVDDEIRRKAVPRERHVFLAVCYTDGSFLTVTRGELVTNLWYLGRTRADLDEPQPFRVGREQDLIDDSVLCAPEWRRHVSFCVQRRLLTQFLGVSGDRRRLSDNHIVTRDTDTGCHNTVVIELVVSTRLQSHGVG